MVEQGLITMHGRSGHLWWPVKQGVIPLGKSLFTVFNVVLVLALNVVLVEAKLGVWVPSVHFMFNLL